MKVLENHSVKYFTGYGLVKRKTKRRSQTTECDVARTLLNEIHTWLEIDPRGLDDSAAQHLSSLPGYESNELIRKLVEQFRPPDNVSAWPDKTDALDSWISNYGKFLRRCFFRRELKEEHDPAIGFGRWLKDNPTMCFEHRRHSYFRVGQAVQDATSHKDGQFFW